MDEGLNRVSEFQGYSPSRKSYSKWAARELLLYLELHPDTPPLIAVEEFSEQMDEYALMNPAGNYIFMVAKDVADYVTDVLSTY